jgi:hypothetical protein
MATSGFTIGFINQTIKLESSQISGGFDGLNSFLYLPLELTSRQPSRDYMYDVQFTEARLNLVTTELSKTNLFNGVNMNSHVEKFEKQDFIQCKFILNIHSLRHIEKYREGDVVFKVSIHGNIRRNDKNSGSSDYSPISGAEIEFRIPQSNWILLLSNMHYESLKLVEIPLKHKHLKEAYDDIIYEFNNAEEHFKNQNYNDCVGACRKVMDSLTVNLKNFTKNEIVSNSNFKWLEKINKISLEYIDSTNKANSSVTSKPHHSGHKTPFNRFEAESIYLTTLSLMNYVGHLSNSN